MPTGAFALLSAISELFACLIPQRQFVLPTEKCVVFTKGREPRVQHNTAFWYWPMMTEIMIFDIADKPHFLTSHKITTTDQKTICVDIIAMTKVVNVMEAGLKINHEEFEEMIKVSVNMAISRWASGYNARELVWKYHNRDGSLVEMASERLSYFGIRVTEIEMVELAISDCVITHFGIRETE